MINSTQQQLKCAVIFETKKTELIKKIITGKIQEKVYLIALTYIKSLHISKIYLISDDNPTLSAQLPQQDGTVHDITITDEKLYGLTKSGVTIFSLEIDDKLAVSAETHHSHMGAIGFSPINENLIGLINDCNSKDGQPLLDCEGAVIIMRSSVEKIEFKLKTIDGITRQPTSITHCGESFFISAVLVSYRLRRSLGSEIYQVDENSGLRKIANYYDRILSRLDPISDTSFVAWGDNGYKIIKEGKKFEGYRGPIIGLIIHNENQIFILKNKKVCVKKIGEKEFQELKSDKVISASRRLSKWFSGQSSLIKEIARSDSNFYILRDKKVFSYALKS
ncbi:MAG: hypothetical protein JJU12_02155 [Chlamydiales bacterium]|nr:hypothetical protein [Chlamydiales bacterium]